MSTVRRTASINHYGKYCGNENLTDLREKSPFDFHFLIAIFERIHNFFAYSFKFLNFGLHQKSVGELKPVRLEVSHDSIPEIPILMLFISRKTFVVF